MISIKIKRFEHSHGLPMPQQATKQSAGMDLYAAINSNILIKTRKIVIIPTGIALSLPENYEGQIRSRSGLALKYGVTVLNSPGTIDSDYRGEIKIILINCGEKDFLVERGMRIAQIVVARYEHVGFDEFKSLDQSERGSDGFGSTGI